MNEEILNDVLSKSTQDDWIVDDDSSTFTYKKDFNLQIMRAPYEHQVEFNEPWAISHPDPSAKMVNYVVKYRDGVVKREALISVDGHRAEIPMPLARDDLKVKKSDVNFAKIVATGSDMVDEYIERSKIEVIEG